MKKPFFLIINGGDGAGKGTQKQFLLEEFKDTVQIREPGGTEEAEQIRLVILDADLHLHQRVEIVKELLKNEKVINLCKKYLEKALGEMSLNGLTGKAEAYLFAASRSQSNELVVKPALKENKIILGDRGIACSMAYQGSARGLGMDFVWDINKEAVKDAYPHLEIFLDLPLEISMERLKGRTEKQDRLDKETKDFHTKVREGYLTYYKEYCPYPSIIVDATGTIEEVRGKIKNIIKDYL